MSIKKSQKTLSEKCAQKQGFTPFAGTKTDKVFQKQENITHPPDYAP